MRMVRVKLENKKEVSEQMVEWPPYCIESFMIRLLEEVEAGHKVTLKMEERK